MWGNVSVVIHNLWIYLNLDSFKIANLLHTQKNETIKRRKPLEILPKSWLDENIHFENESSV